MNPPRRNYRKGRQAEPSERPDQKSRVGQLRRIYAPWLSLQPRGSLAIRIVHAGLWATVTLVVVRAVNSGRTIILGNLLEPRDFGVMAVVLIVVGFLARFTETGFEAALVQRPGDVRSHLNTAFTTQVFRGVLLALLLVLTAPLIGAFFGSEDSVNAIRVVAIGVLISGFRNIGIIYVSKDLEFQKDFLVKVLPTILAVIVSIILALLVRNYWALVLGLVARRGFEVVGTYVVAPYRPAFAFDRNRFTDLARFGKWILGSHILVYMSLNLDTIAVARLLDETALGLYAMAFTIAQMPTAEITTAVGRVAFPAFAKLQEQPDRLRSAYLKAIQLVALATFPLSAGLWLIGPEVVETLMGAKWLPMIGALNILLLWGLLRSMRAPTGPLFQALGKPQIATFTQLLQVVVLAGAVFPLTAWLGLVGAAWATAIAAAPATVVATVLAVRTVNSSGSEVLRRLAFPAAHTALMLAVLAAVESTSGMKGLTWMAVSVGLGGVVYGGAIFMSRRFFGYLADGLLPRASVATDHPEGEKT